jgi:hypothetical protein
MRTHPSGISQSPSAPVARNSENEPGRSGDTHHDRRLDTRRCSLRDDYPVARLGIYIVHNNRDQPMYPAHHLRQLVAPRTAALPPTTNPEPCRNPRENRASAPSRRGGGPSSMRRRS